MQQECIPQAILGMDVLCQAKSGMGKTAVFVLATLQQLETSPTSTDPSVIVLCHTRELAYQIKNEYARFSKYMPDVKTGVLYGGTSVKQNTEMLQNEKPQIIVGTPGRVQALIRDKVLNLKNVKHFVLDECDKMLESLGELLLLCSAGRLKEALTRKTKPTTKAQKIQLEKSDDIVHAIKPSSLIFPRKENLKR